MKQNFAQIDSRIMFSRLGTNDGHMLEHLIPRVVSSPKMHHVLPVIFYLNATNQKNTNLPLWKILDETTYNLSTRYAEVNQNNSHP